MAPGESLPTLINYIHVHRKSVIQKKVASRALDAIVNKTRAGGIGNDESISESASQPSDQKIEEENEEERKITIIPTNFDDGEEKSAD